MKKGYIKGFTKGCIVLGSKTAQRRGYVIGDLVTIQLKCKVEDILEDRDMILLPEMDGNYIHAEYERYFQTKTDRQGRFFFSFIGFHSNDLKRQGHFDMTEFYEMFKAYIDSVRPNWKMFESIDHFSIKLIGKVQEFEELMNYADIYLSEVMEIDTSNFWAQYESEYKNMGYTR